MGDQHRDYDIIIIGAGIAGLTAAVRSLELGLRVLVLEKGVEEIYPCNTRQSGGVIHIGFLDPYRPQVELVDIINQQFYQRLMASVGIMMDIITIMIMRILVENVFQVSL